MELVAALPHRADQTSRFEHIEMLRDGLPGGPQPMSHQEPRADFEERLPISLAELVEDGPPGRVSERSVDVAHTATIRKPLLACQGSRHWRCCDVGRL